MKPSGEWRRMLGLDYRLEVCVLPQSIGSKGEEILSIPAASGTMEALGRNQILAVIIERHDRG